MSSSHFDNGNSSSIYGSAMNGTSHFDNENDLITNITSNISGSIYHNNNIVNHSGDVITITTISSTSSSFATEEYYYTLSLTLSSITTGLSCLGSFAIIFASYKRLHSIYQRLIFTISLWEGLSSFVFLLHHYAVPSYARSYGLYVASGNAATCTFVGYWFYLGPILVSFYSFYLSLYFYAKIKYNVLDITIKQKCMIPANVIALFVSFLIPTLGLFYNGYQPRPFWNLCTNGGFVIGEGNYERHPCSNMALIVEILYTFIIMILALLSVVATIGLCYTVHSILQKSAPYRFPITTIAATPAPITNRRSVNDNSNHLMIDDHRDRETRMISVLSPQLDDCDNPSEMRRSEATTTTDDADLRRSLPAHSIDNATTTPPQEATATTRRSARPSGSRSRRRMRASTSFMMTNYYTSADDRNTNVMMEVRNQGLLYAFVYWNSFFWILMKFVIDQMKSRTGITTTIYVLSMMYYIFFPIQGFFNFLVYTRPRYMEFRQKFPHCTKWRAFYFAVTLRSASECTNYFTDSEDDDDSSSSGGRRNTLSSFFRRISKGNNGAASRISGDDDSRSKKDRNSNYSASPSKKDRNSNYSNRSSAAMAEAFREMIMNENKWFMSTESGMTSSMKDDEDTEHRDSNGECCLPMRSTNHDDDDNSNNDDDGNDDKLETESNASSILDQTDFEAMLRVINRSIGNAAAGVHDDDHNNKDGNDEEEEIDFCSERRRRQQHQQQRPGETSTTTTTPTTAPTSDAVHSHLTRMMDSWRGNVDDQD